MFSSIQINNIIISCVYACVCVCACSCVDMLLYSAEEGLAIVCSQFLFLLLLLLMPQLVRCIINVDYYYVCRPCWDTVLPG